MQFTQDARNTILVIYVCLIYITNVNGAYVRLFIYFSYQLNRIASKLNLAIITPDGEVRLRNIAGRGSESRS